MHLATTSAAAAAAAAVGLLSLGQLAFAEQKPLTGLSVRGVDPTLADRYDPSPSGTFMCLDGSAEIPFAAVNDDYCDCPDGSDEPGTSACPNGVFHCRNGGHVPGVVLSSRVNDGLCDPECCDGTDEWATGACPDRCAEIGKEHRERTEAEAKTRKTGSKIRASYIKWADGERKRLAAELSEKEAEVKVKEAEVERARIALETTEARSKEELERRKKSPLFVELLNHRLALARLRSRVTRAEKELDALHGILEDLAKSYNPNYQDMAVKAAVVGYEELTKVLGVPEGEAAPETESYDEIGDRELDELERKDFDSVILADMSDVDTSNVEGGILYRIEEYIPDSLYDQWETVRDLAIDWLIRLGLVGRAAKGKPDGHDAPHVAAARQKHSDLNNELNRLRREIQTSTDTLEKMGSGFGPAAEWKKLDGKCIDTVAGDYTYEVCFFGRATQKSNKDSSSNFLGTFSEWNNSATVGTYEYYSRQVYNNGAKCWNGPLRSATVDFVCGKDNALLSVSEPEKCEYRFKATSPALCWPLESSSTAAPSIKEEL